MCRADCIFGLRAGDYHYGYFPCRHPKRPGPLIAAVCFFSSQETLSKEEMLELLTTSYDSILNDEMKVCVCIFLKISRPG